MQRGLMAVLSLGVQLCFWGQRGGGHEDYTEETQGAKKMEFMVANIFWA